MKPGVSALRNEGGYTSNAKETVDVLAKTYSLMLTPGGYIPSNAVSNHNSSAALKDLTVCQDDVLERRHKLSPRKLPGTDGIAPIILSCAAHLASSLTDSFNHSLRMGIFPDILKG